VAIWILRPVDARNVDVAIDIGAEVVVQFLAADDSAFPGDIVHRHPFIIAPHSTNLEYIQPIHNGNVPVMKISVEETTRSCLSKQFLDETLQAE
jgi:hypothetical protein